MLRRGSSEAVSVAILAIVISTSSYYALSNSSQSITDNQRSAIDMHQIHTHSRKHEQQQNGNAQWRNQGSREGILRTQKKDTLILDGMKAYYNFTKKHGALKGKAPSEAALIEVNGKNRWKTIIQNASLYKQNQAWIF